MTEKKISITEIAAMHEQGKLHCDADASETNLPDEFWDKAKVVTRQGSINETTHVANTVIVWGVPKDLSTDESNLMHGVKRHYECIRIVGWVDSKLWSIADPMTPGALHLCSNPMPKNEVVMVDGNFRVTGGIIHITYEQACAMFRDLEAREMMRRPGFTAAFLTELANQVHANNVAAGWWTDLKTGEDLHGKRNVPEMLMLAVSELAEAMEAYRKNLKDDKITHRPGLRVEVADCIIRLLDLMGSAQNDEHPFGVIFEEKRAYNARREDHKIANRLKEGGKVF